MFILLFVHRHTSIMPLVPYVEDVEAIIDHIVKGKKGPIQMRSNPPPMPPVIVKMVSPIQQQAEMVEAELRDKNEKEKQIKKKRKLKKHPWDK